VNLRAALLPGEQITRRECEAVERALDERLREGDRYCACPDGSYVLLLSSLTENEAAIVAQRLAGEVSLRVAIVNRRSWRATIAAYPHDALTSAALQRLAKTGARNTAVK
jgi:hypothetical protein